MLTENDARALLAQAADTIEVGPAAPVEPVRRRAWPVLLAAAVATVVAGVGVWAGVGALDTDAAPDPAVDTGPVQPGTVPSVFGHRRAEATRLLEQSGLEVRVVERPTCDLPGQAVGTLPSTGSRLQPGSTVTLQVATDVGFNCALDLEVPWELLALATGELASPPLLQGPLVAYVDGGRHDVPDGSDPEAWGSPSALDTLSSAVEWSPAVPRSWRTLEQQEPGCDGEAFLPEVSSGTPTQRYAIAFDGPDAPCVQLAVVGRFGAPPAAVAVESTGLEEQTSPDDDQSPVPDTATIPPVFGLTEGEALKALQDAEVGSLVVEAEPGCLAPSRALRTEPQAGTPIGATDSVRLTITAVSDDAECESLATALFDMVDVARGGPTPALSSEIRTWRDGVELTPPDPDDRSTWADAPVLASVAAVVDDTRPDEVQDRLFRVGGDGAFPADCLVGDRAPTDVPADLSSRTSTRAWFAYQRDDETGACFVLDVYTDAQDRIDALVVRTQDPDGLLPKPGE